ncbi:MAG: [FeFe] hydrogenase H-cluster radical SAM maturase HydE [Syntrophomonadaceae bacterium]|nr:[FeFe] hydrogenase H-cluster radical SAM maturase HydE [Syntrophomonadaceae bacterium]
MIKMTLSETIKSNYQKNLGFSPDQLRELLSSPDLPVLEVLQNMANQVRQIQMGKAVHLRGIIEFSNYCSRNCAYCGLNRYNTALHRYRMSPENIIIAAHHAASLGLRTVVLQSGEDAFYTGEILAMIIKEIKKTGVALTLSVGERPFQDLQLWREAGADRYLLKFETSDPDLYARLHPGHQLADRLTCLQHLKELGYQVGSGNIVGLPGQTVDILVNDLLLMQSLPLAMAGVGPFIPHSDTALGPFPPGNVPLTLKLLALTRLLLPRVHLPATTALSSLQAEGKILGLNGGANVLMLNLTPVAYRSLYEIYPQKSEVSEAPEQLVLDTHRLIKEIGREVATDPGHGRLS